MNTEFQLSAQSRHTRYLFFVDSNYPYDKLRALVNHNQRMWGGRYNPIIPVVDSVIASGYADVIKYYDPDFIFYSQDVSVENLKKLNLFNPQGYYNLDDQPRSEDIMGVDALYLISQFASKRNVLMPDGLWETKSPLLNYFELNFGITQTGIVSDYNITSDFAQIIINKDNYATLNQVIHEKKPVNQAHLSQRNLNTRILRTRSDTRYNVSELIISKGDGTNADLFYFWNRQLFECHNLLYVTVNELKLLCTDRFFGGVLRDLSSEQTIHVISLSLEAAETRDLIANEISKIAFERQYSYKPVEKFPFEVLDGNGHYPREYGEPNVIQTLLSNRGLMYVPMLSFTDKVEFYGQKWVVELQIKEVKNNAQVFRRFPLTTDSGLIVKRVKGRINSGRNICFFIHNQLDKSGTVELDIPLFSELVKQLISFPVIQGETIHTKYVDVGPHDSSGRLAGFIKMFDGDFSVIDFFFKDKFWVDIFNELCTSEKVPPDIIFFKDILERCKKIYEEHGNVFGEKGETYINVENLSLGLKETMRQLCAYGVFLQGFRLKCSSCSSIFWYHIKEVANVIECKGCLQSFRLPVEPEFSYKLNDLIRNNIFQSRTQRDGNLAVIRTLVNFSERKSRNSFQYSPQINLYDDYTNRKPLTDIDIMALVDGQLIIGEAKHNSHEFSANGHKSLNSLIELARAIYPDKLMVACYTDENEKLEKARKYLEYHFKHAEYSPEIEMLLLHTPDYFNFNARTHFQY